MQYVEMYMNAIKKINKKYYLTPFLLLVYLYYFFEFREIVTTFLNAEDKYYILFITSFIQVYGIVFLQLFFYPHANFFIQSTRLYQGVFGTFMSTLKSGFSNFFNIGKNIPNDYTVKGSNGTRYTISSGSKSKSERVHESVVFYLLYSFLKILFKDIILRLIIHLGIFIVSPIIFLFAVPILNKDGRIQLIEKQYD